MPVQWHIICPCLQRRATQSAFKFYALGQPWLDPRSNVYFVQFKNVLEWFWERLSQLKVALDPVEWQWVAVKAMELTSSAGDRLSPRECKWVILPRTYTFRRSVNCDEDSSLITVSESSTWPPTSKGIHDQNNGFDINKLCFNGRLRKQWCFGLDTTIEELSQKLLRLNVSVVLS